MNRKGPWEGYSLGRCLLPAFLCAHISSRERRLGTRQSLYKDMLPLKIYPYLSDPRNKRNRRKICRNVQFTESMGQLWLAINLYSIYIPMISGDFLTRWNAIIVGNGRGSEEKEGQFWAFSYFWIEVFRLVLICRRCTCDMAASTAWDTVPMPNRSGRQH